MSDGIFNIRLFLRVNELALQLVTVLVNRLLGSDFSKGGLEVFHVNAVRVLTVAVNSVHHLGRRTLSLQDCIFFTLESFELALDIGVVEVEHVGTIIELRELIVAPLFFIKHVVLLGRNVEVTSTTILFLKLLNGWTLFLDALNDGVRNVGRPIVIVALFGLCDMKPVHDGLVLLRVLALLCKAMIEEDVARLGLHVVEAFKTDVRHLDQVGVGFAS